MIKYFTRLLLFYSTIVTAQELPDSQDGPFLDYARAQVEKAISDNPSWDGPTLGPNAVSGMHVIFVASDLRNGGVYGVARGMSEAISHLDWHLRFLDGLGSEVRQGAAIRKAIGFRPDAIVLGGIDASRHKEVLLFAQSKGITVVGWHATEAAGVSVDNGLYTNITTDPTDVAEIAALLAIVNSNGKANALIFTDPNYKIATLKSNAMANTIQRCQGCKLLEVKPLHLDKIAEQMPRTMESLWKKHGQSITHILAINDLYIDYAIPSIESNKKKNNPVPQNISAGDGSKAAYKRIYGAKYQLATVPEPLYLQGWQIIDELNRAFNHLPPSGYSAPVHLVTPDNVSSLISARNRGVYDPDNGYREAYLKIWKP